MKFQEESHSSESMLRSSSGFSSSLIELVYHAEIDSGKCSKSNSPCISRLYARKPRWMDLLILNWLQFQTCFLNHDYFLEILVAEQGALIRHDRVHPEDWNQTYVLALFRHWDSIQHNFTHLQTQKMKKNCVSERKKFRKFVFFEKHFFIFFLQVFSKFSAINFLTSNFLLRNITEHWWYNPNILGSQSPWLEK